MFEIVAPPIKVYLHFSTKSVGRPERMGHKTCEQGRIQTGSRDPVILSHS